jgi:hypothetical protein
MRDDAMNEPRMPRTAAALLVGAWAMAWSLLPPENLRAETIATISPADLSACSILVDRATNVATGSGSTRRFAAIQAAVDAAKPGDIVCVGAGDHNDERVAVTRSGTAKAPIRIRALGDVRMAGFVVKANHVAIEGFTVSNRSLGEDQEGRAMGIYLSGTGLKAIGNTVIDTASDGIGCDAYPPSCTDVLIARNTVRGVDGTGIVVAGRRILVEGNDVSRSVVINSSDADGMRFFGSEITFRGNYIHDISDRGYPEGENPHTDCFQTFDNAKPSTTNVVIENNICDNVDHQCLIATALRKQSAGIKFRNNICNNNGSQGVFIRNFRSIEVTNNLFLPSIKYFAVRAEAESTKTTIANNIFVGEFWPYDIDDSSRAGLKTDYNLADHPGQATQPEWWKFPEQHGIWTTDPKFVRAGDGKFDAYRPGPGSPLIDRGSNAYGAASTDLAGNPRIVDGNGDGIATIDIGPYEFTATRD